MHGRLLHLAAGARQDAHQVVGAACRSSQVCLYVPNRQPPGKVEGITCRGADSRAVGKVHPAVDSLQASVGSCSESGWKAQQAGSRPFSSSLDDYLQTFEQCEGSCRRGVLPMSSMELITWQTVCAQLPGPNQ